MNGQLISSGEQVKFLDVNIDNSLKFKTHVRTIQEAQSESLCVWKIATISRRARIEVSF